MSVKATAAEAAAAWKTGFAGSSAKYTAGINAVTTAPGQLAAAQKAAYVRGVQENENIWASKVAAVDINTWKAAATGVGAGRLASGGEKGMPKMQQFMTNFLPVLSQTVSTLPPRGSFEQNLQRFTTYATQLHGKKGTF